MATKTRSSRDEQGDVLKGLAAGLIGGLVASYVMNEFQSLWQKASEAVEQERSKQSLGGSKGSKGQQKQQGGEEGPPATVQTAEAISETVFDHELTKSEKKVAGPAVHYAFGTTMGAFYGAAAELAPQVTTGAGLLFGTTVWLGADEVALPALGLSKSPTEYPLSKHAYALVSHFVYGLTADLVRRGVRSAL
ncbi:MAG: DUF1440 domain-containing protein [Pyrinomonadaceae bacterium]